MAIRLHPGQSKVYKDLFIDKTCRFAAVCCSRGWGKSYKAAVAASTAVFELMELSSLVPNKNVYIIAPTYDQVTDIYYPLLNYDLGLENYAIKSSRDLGRFLFPGNVELRLLSYEAVERMRGKGAYFVVIDEPTSYNRGLDLKEAWQSVIQPCILTRWSPARAKYFKARSPGRALVISTPKGYDFFYDMFNMHEIDNQWRSYHFDYTQSPYIDVEEIERIRHTIDPLQFAREYLASFQESGNNLFYCFDRKIHVRNDLPYFVEGEDVHVAIDFNVGIMAASAFGLRGKQMHFLDEFKGHPDTETLAKVLKKKYEGHRVICYPDPTGKSRKTSASTGKTDLNILAAAGFEVRARNGSPPIVDSTAAVNRKLKTASGHVDMFFAAHLTNLILSMERTKWKENNPNVAEIDKTEGVEHHSDGVRYATENLFPVLSSSNYVRRGFNF